MKKKKEPEKVEETMKPEVEAGQRWFRTKLGALEVLDVVKVRNGFAICSIFFDIKKKKIPIEKFKRRRFQYRGLTADLEW